MDNFTMSAYEEQCLKNRSIYSNSVCVPCDVEFKFDLYEQRKSSIKEL